jgi:hypothetical protein
MKKLSFYTLAALALVVVSCNSDDANPASGVPYGAMVLIDQVVSPVLNVTDIENANYSVDLRDPSNNVAEFRFYARLVRGGVAQTDYALIETVTTFPSRPVLTSQEFVDAWDEIDDIDEFLPGDRIEFSNEVTSKDGVVFTAGDIGPDLANNPGQRSAFRPVTFVSCPFVIADAIGTYELIEDQFDVYFEDYFDVVGTGNPAQLKMVDPFGYQRNFPGSFAPGSMDVVADVNVNTGQTTIARQRCWNVTIFVPSLSGGFIASPAANGSFTFSCTGTIAYRLTFSVDQGTYAGAWRFTAALD